MLTQVTFRSNNFPPYDDEEEQINSGLWGKRLRDRCNDHTHYNFYRNVLLNDKEILLEGRRKALEEFSNDLRDVLILHVSYMFFANGHYMMSSDYVDCLECGMTPEPDSQYWVAPFVQEIFDQTLMMSKLQIIIRRK